VDRNEIDWLLIGRYALLIALTALIPVPILDTGVENVLRRRLARALGDRHGVSLTEEAIATLANTPTGGCVGCVWSVIVWPFRKVLKTVLFVFLLKGMADSVSEVVHRALMLEEALELGWLPGDPDRVRVAMDQALIKVDTRVVERQILGVFQDHTHELNRVIFETIRLAKTEERKNRSQAIADAVAADELGSGAHEMSAAMAASLRTMGTVPELMAWFRAEMNEGPKAVDGPVEPELLAADATEAPRALPDPEVEDAVEVSSTSDPEESEP